MNDMLRRRPASADFCDRTPHAPIEPMQAAFLALFAAYVSLLPIANTIALRYIVFIALLGLTATALWRARQWPALPLATAWGAYAVVGALSLLAAIDPAASLGEFKTEILYCFAVFIVGSVWGERFGRFMPFLAVLALANALLSVTAWCFASYSMSTPEAQQIPRIAYAGLNSNWILIAIFFYALAIPRLWRRRQRLAALALLLLIGLDLWAMTVGANRQNWVALAAGICCAGVVLLYFRFSWRRLGAWIALLGIVVAIFAWQTLRRAPPPLVVGTETAPAPALTQDVRLEIWSFTWKKIAAQPWSGAGMGRDVFKKAYPDYQARSPEQWHAHNMLLNKGVQMGLPGMLAFLLLWLALGRRLVGHLRDDPARRLLATAGLAAVAATFVKNMTDDFFVRDVALLFWLVMGLLLGSLRRAPPGEDADRA